MSPIFVSLGNSTTPNADGSNVQAKQWLHRSLQAMVEAMHNHATFSLAEQAVRRPKYMVAAFSATPSQSELWLSTMEIKGVFSWWKSLGFGTVAHSLLLDK